MYYRYVYDSIYSMYQQYKMLLELIWIKPTTISKRTFTNCQRYARLCTIYDGDTLTVITKLHWSESYDKYQLRLAGIDAPELKPKYNIDDRVLHVETAKHVRNVLQQLLPIGSILWITFAREEKYGRLLGTIWYNPRPWMFWQHGININQWLLDHDMVIAYHGKGKNEFSTYHLQSITFNCLRYMNSPI